MDKDHRITPFQQADNGDSFISPRLQHFLFNYGEI